MPVNNYTLISQKINSLDDCVSVFEEAIQNGDVFDKEDNEHIVFVLARIHTSPQHIATCPKKAI